MNKTKLVATLFIACAITVGLSLTTQSNHYEINAATTADFGQLYDFLLTKNEHYHYSDEYIKQYQQESGGYIDLWKSLGGTVDKQNCTPNQYWHFFESWCKPSIDDGSFKFTASGSRGYSYFACPELQLWIIEASGISEDKIIQAYNAAIEGKQNNDRVNTICAAMRAIVPWSDINTQILNNLPTNPNYHVSPAVDKDNHQYTMSKFNYDGYQPGTTVTFTIDINDNTKEINSVTGTNVSISSDDGIYSFVMPSNHVDLEVILIDKGSSGGEEEEEPPVISNDGYKIVTSMDELIDGAKVIIGTHNTFRRLMAISTTQTANNRTAINMVKDGDYYKVSQDPVQEVELCVFTISSVVYEEHKYYQFYDVVNNGYLYVCSNSSNYLRTQATNNVNGYFDITMDGSKMLIQATASSYTRNIIGNYSSMFSGYAGGTSATTVELALYADVVETTKVWANSYLKMNDPSFMGTGSGLCKSEGLYENAKTALMSMGEAYIYSLRHCDDETLLNALNRYESWALANNDDNPYNENGVSSSIYNVYNIESNYIILVFLIATLSFGSLLFFIRKHKKN